VTLGIGALSLLLTLAALGLPGRWAAVVLAVAAFGALLGWTLSREGIA
jgi:hypothetical protein